MNRVSIDPTKFVDARDNHETLGYRAYDDHASAYCNTFDYIPDNDLDFLKMVIWDNPSDAVSDMLDFIEEHEKGLFIGSTYYEWDEIKHLFGGKDAS